jgi:intein-encoded DNA endonuclease-like protein
MAHDRLARSKAHILQQRRLCATRFRILQKKQYALQTFSAADHPVKEVTIAFGGDMVEGLFNFPSQAFEIDSTLFEQYVNVSRLIVDVVRFALANYEKVTVVPEWGNHGRIGSKRDNVPKLR